MTKKNSPTPPPAFVPVAKRVTPPPPAGGRIAPRLPQVPVQAKPARPNVPPVFRPARSIQRALVLPGGGGGGGVGGDPPEDWDPEWWKKFEKKGSSKPDLKEEAADEAEAWILEDGDVTEDDGTYAADLATLSARVAGGTGNLYSRQIGTLVGGQGVRSGVRIGGVTASARIDRQNPPPGAYNVAFQVGANTYGAVLFTDTDDAATVLAQLTRAYNNGQIAVSPSAQAARALREASRRGGGKKPAKK